MKKNSRFLPWMILVLFYYNTKIFSYLAGTTTTKSTTTNRFVTSTVFTSVEAISVTVTFNDKEKTSLDKLWGNVRRRYNQLPSQGKFVTGTIVGYGGAKAVIGSATTCFKVAGTIFVVSEVMHLSGVLDDTQNSWRMMEQQQSKINQLQTSAKEIIKDCRTQVQQTFNPNTCQRRLKRYIQQDKYGPAGLATGILLGLA